MCVRIGVNKKKIMIINESVHFFKCIIIYLTTDVQVDQFNGCNFIVLVFENKIFKGVVQQKGVILVNPATIFGSEC